MNATGRSAPPPVRRSTPPQQRPAPRKPGSAAAARKKKQRTNLLVIAAVAAVLLIAILIGVLVVNLRKPADDGKILSNVYAAGVNLGGMTPEQAKAALHGATDNTYSTLDMSVRLLDTEITLAPKDTGARLDVDGVVDAAYQYGRAGSRAEQQRIRDQAQSSSYTISILPYLSLDTGYIRSAVNELGARYSTTLKQTTYRIEGTRPVIEPGTQDTTVTYQTLTIRKGTAEYGLNTEALYEQIMDAYNINLFEVVGTCSVIAPDPLDYDAMYSELNLYTAPIDATQDPDTYEITTETYGYGISMEDLKTIVDAMDYGSEQSVSLHYIAPDITAEFYNQEMFRDELASFSTDLTGDSDWNTNLRLACQMLNGRIIKANEEFSFNSLIGEPTVRAGFKSVGVYVGKSYRQIVGGGLSQVATTLYNCALLADMEILERHSHSYAPTFVTTGFDAEVYYGNLDFRFRNTSAQPIRIESGISGGKMVIRFIGTDSKDYTVELTYKVDKTKEPITVYNTMLADNPGGYKNGDVLVNPIAGCDVSVYMRKYSKLTGNLISEDLISTSVYAKLDRVVVKIKAEEPVEPTDPTDPTDPADPTDPTDTSGPT